MTLAAGLLLLSAPVARAENVVAGPSRAYLTPNVTIDQGEPLTFYNFDALAHDVTAHDKGSDGKPLFATPLLDAFENSFVEGSQYLKTGSYAFFCSIHSEMHGTITVTSAGTPAPRPGGGGPSSSDTKRPAVRVKVRSGGVAAVRRSGKLAVEVSVDEAAKVALKASARISGRKVTLGSGSLELTTAGSRRESLKLTRSGRRALAGRSRAAVTVTAKAVDPAGNARTAKASRTLG